MDLELAKKVAIEAAKEAGAVLLENIEKAKKMSLKGKSDIVTEVDHASEKLIIEKIKKYFPDHSILSEEQGFTEKDSTYTWIIDPIDGTINYFHGHSPFRVAICLVKDKKPILSVLLNPLRNELCVALKGEGTAINGKLVHVTDNNELKKSVVMTHLSSKRKVRSRIIAALDSIFSQTLHIRAFGSGLSSMEYVAKGKFDIFFNIGTYAWDILPGALIIEEAGGKVTDIEGNEITTESTTVLATNGKVHGEMLKLLAGI